MTGRPFSLFQRFLRNSKAKDGDLSLADFIHYVREHEKNLRLHFSHLDRNKDGEYRYGFQEDIQLNFTAFNYFILSNSEFQTSPIAVCILFCNVK